MITTPLPTKRFDVAIVGLGYVGVPLALGFAKAGCKTLGYDTDHQRVRELQQGRSPFAHISSTDLVDILADGTLEHFKQRRTRNEQTIQLRREQKLYQEPYRWR